MRPYSEILKELLDIVEISSEATISCGFDQDDKKWGAAVIDKGKIRIFIHETEWREIN